MTRLVSCAAVIALTWCVLQAQTPQAKDQATPPAAARERTSRTYKPTLAFDRESLEGAMKRISEEIGVPIKIEKHDLQLEGITPGQSWGLSESELTVEQLLQKYLGKVNPDGKLAYVVRKSPPGIETVHVVTRSGAAQRGETLFPEFTLGPPKRPAAFIEPSWSSCIRPTTIESEVLRQIAALGDALKSERPEKAARASIVQLAVLFHIVEVFDVSIRWKNDASSIREALVQNRPPLTPWDAQRRQRLDDLHSDLQHLLVDDKWPRTAEETAKRTWDQVAPRPDIMRRLEFLSTQRLARHAQLSEPAAIARDAEVIAALAKAIQDSSYEFAGDSEYARYAQAFEQQARTVAEAAAKGAAQLKVTIERLQTKCNDCHSSFR